MGKCVDEVYPVTLTEISAGEVQSSSGQFSVNIYSPNKIFGLPGIPVGASHGGRTAFDAMQSGGWVWNRGFREGDAVRG